MKKLLLMSVLIANVAIPIWAAKQPNPRAALKGALIALLAFNVVYAVVLIVIYPHLF